MTRKEYAEQVREKSIENMMRHGYTRKQAEQSFDWTTDYYNKNYSRQMKDEYSAIIRVAHESLYGCGMRDEILKT